MPASTEQPTNDVAKLADMFSAMGIEPRLRMIQLLLNSDPAGMVVCDIQQELDIPNSTLSYHLDKLKNEDLVLVRRESTFLRYIANTEALQELGVDKLAPLVDGKFMSAFIRAVKPTNPSAKSYCGPTCCN